MDTNSQEAEALRKRILEDPNTAKIAESLEVPLDEYVKQVVHFVLHPTEEPSLYIVEDADLEAMGTPAPDSEEMGRYILEAVAVAEAADKTEFVEAQKKLVQLPESPAPGTGSEQDDPKLKAEADKFRRADSGRQG
jgi:hypothetical protein